MERTTAKPSLTANDVDGSTPNAFTRPPHKLGDVVEADFPEVDNVASSRVEPVQAARNAATLEDIQNLQAITAELQQLRTMRDHLKRLHVDLSNASDRQRENAAKLQRESAEAGTLAMVLSAWSDKIDAALKAGGTP